MSSGVILLQRPYVSFSSPLLLILRREITAAAVALFLFQVKINFVNELFNNVPGSSMFSVLFTLTCLLFILVKPIFNVILTRLNFKMTQLSVIISPDESRGYIGFTSIVPPPPPYVLTCVRNNSKMLSRISFKLGTHMYLGQERNPILRWP